MSRNAAESELCFDLRAAHICTRIYPRFLSDSGEIRYKASAHNAVNSLRASWKSAVRKRHLCYGGRSWNCNYQTVRYFEIKIIFKFFVYVTAYTIAIWNSSLLTNFSEYSNIKFHENPLRLLMPRSEQSNTHGDANRRILAKVQFVTRMWIIYIYIDLNDFNCWDGRTDMASLSVPSIHADRSTEFYLCAPSGSYSSRWLMTSHVL